jgi:hypothetical protein
MFRKADISAFLYFCLIYLLFVSQKEGLFEDGFYQLKPNKDGSSSLYSEIAGRSPVVFYYLKGRKT